MNYLLARVVLFIFLSGLCACSSQHYAPVNNAWSPDTSSSVKQYRVQPGDTLYAIAWRYDMDYRALAEANHLSAPYTVEKGQILSLNVPKKMTELAVQPMIQSEQAPQWIETTNTAASTKSEHKVVQNPVMQSSVAKPVVQSSKVVTQSTSASAVISSGEIQWRWPAKGKIIATYSPKMGKKGVDIAGKLGEPIYAAAAGKVAYCGNGLKGYGNLIIIKHNDEFLSAYAHNQKLLVHEGEQVKAGQMIATMGKTESKRVMLHFEIREAGQSVNPLRYVKP